MPDPRLLAATGISGSMLPGVPGSVVELNESAPRVSAGGEPADIRCETPSPGSLIRTFPRVAWIHSTLPPSPGPPGNIEPDMPLAAKDVGSGIRRRSSKISKSRGMLGDTLIIWVVNSETPHGAGDGRELSH